MTNNLDLPPSHDNEPINEKLLGLFEALLNDAAEQLELACPTDETIFETKNAVFGKFSEDTIRLAHTITRSRIIGNKHAGTIEFICSDDPEKNLLFNNAPRHTRLWVAPGEKGYSGRGVLSKLEENWPIADDFSREAFQKFEPKNEEIEAEDQRPDVLAQTILELLENYSLRRNTGEHTYEMKWWYTDLNAGIVNGKMCEQTIIFSISSDQKDSLRKIALELKTARPGIMKRISYYICTDELGTTTMRADTLDPLTMLRHHMPIDAQDVGEILAIAERLLHRLITVKMQQD